MILFCLLVIIPSPLLSQSSHAQPSAYREITGCHQSCREEEHQWKQPDDEKKKITTGWKCHLSSVTIGPIFLFVIFSSIEKNKARHEQVDDRCRCSFHCSLLNRPQGKHKVYWCDSPSSFIIAISWWLCYKHSSKEESDPCATTLSFRR